MTAFFDCDVLVIGSGAGGLSAAVAAAHAGLRVVVAEKAPVFGGTTAFSGGWLWIPNAPHAVRAGHGEPQSDVENYLRRVIGRRFDASLIRRYLTAAPEMVDFFERHTEVRFAPGSGVPDFYGELDNAATGWRSLVACPYDGRKLGGLLYRLRPPLPETTVFGMGVASGADMKHFLQACRSPRSAVYVGKRLFKHAVDLLQRQRGRQLANGNALVARLLKSATDKNVRLLHSTSAVGLLQESGGRVCGAMFDTVSGSLNIRARHGVVLACGGFPHDAKRLHNSVEHVRNGTPHHSAAPETNSGDGLNLAERAGAAVGGDMAAPCAWAPVSLVPREDGSIGRFPHLIERGKPGLIAVDARGRRFTNEAAPYYSFMSDLFAATPPQHKVRAWLVCDHAFLRRYGLGAVKPYPFPIRRWLENGYLKRAQTWEELAAICGISPQLRQTVDDYNREARHGRDPEFGRGGNAYQRVQGDAAHQPNPCVAPIEKAPFYAVEIVPGSLGTFAGIVIDSGARVLDKNGTAIPGLFAAGNDANSIFGGYYPSGGITLGPAMTFGYLAAQTIAAQATAPKAATDDTVAQAV